MNRDTILGGLRHYAASPRPAPTEVAEAAGPAELLDRFAQNIGNARAQVIRCREPEIIDRLAGVYQQHGVRRLCYGLESAVRPWVSDLPADVEGVCYAEHIESFRHELFADIDAGLTTCDAALAETGSLVLTSGVKRPRLLSLVPPLHIAVVRSGDVYPRMADWMAAFDVTRMPSNIILISGPSKSADIEQVLAYGVHGPKQLVVLLVESE